MAADPVAPRCPHCRIDLREVTADAALGYCVVLDQCPQCGGVWCDRWELYPITAAAAARLDPVDGDALRQPSGIASAPLECPRCRARLRAFRDAWLPPDTCLGRCPNCDGIWLNRGQLRSVKSMAPRVPPPAGLPAGAVSVDELTTRLVGAHRPVVRDLSRALEGSEGTETDESLPRDMLGSVAWAVARALIRLLLRL